MLIQVVVLLGLAVALLFLVRNRPLPTPAQPSGPNTTAHSAPTPGWLRPVAVLACSTTLAFLAVNVLFRAVADGTPGILLAALVLAVAGGVAAILRARRAGRGPAPGGAIVSGCIALLVAAALANGNAFSTVLDWGRLALSAPAAAAAATSASGEAAPRGAPTMTATPAPEPTPTATDIASPLSALLASLQDARRANLRIVNEIETPEARERLRRYPAFRASHEAAVREQQQVVAQARGYAELALSTIAATAGQDPSAIAAALESARDQAKDPRDLTVLAALTSAVQGADPGGLAAPTLAAWDEAVTAPQSREPASDVEEESVEDREPDGSSAQPPRPAERRYSRQSGSARDRARMTEPR